MRFKRIFLMVLDGLGVGETSDASNFGDVGSNTLGHIKEKYNLFVPNLKKIGFLDTLNMNEDKDVEAYYSIAKPNNAGKDSLNGHYEMMRIKNNIPFKTFNTGFSVELVSSIEQLTGRKVIGNKCSIDSLAIINELGERQQHYGVPTEFIYKNILVDNI